MIFVQSLSSFPGLLLIDDGEDCLCLLKTARLR